MTPVTAAGEPREAPLVGRFKTGPVLVRFVAASLPGTFALSLHQKRLVTTYACAELPCDEPGRSFRLKKVSDGSDDEMESADVWLPPTGRAACHCKGFLRWGRCKHAAAVELIIESDWLPQPKVYRDED